MIRLAALLSALLVLAAPVGAQETNTVGLSDAALNRIPAKKLFGAEKTPANMRSRAIGTYARGCLAGGVSLPINGPDWQVMRLSPIATGAIRT